MADDENGDVDPTAQGVSFTYKNDQILSVCMGLSTSYFPLFCLRSIFKVVCRPDIMFCVQKMRRSKETSRQIKLL